jgi:hypothetical protein
VRVEGRAAPPPDENLRSPLTGRACVWWDYSIECREEDSQGRKTTYRCIEKATSVTPFVLGDADGECLIGPVGASVTPNCNDRWYGESVHPSGPPPEPGYSLMGNGTYVYHERLITPGTRLSVLGELRSHTEFGAVDQKSHEILDLWKHNQPALLKRFDLDHDGRLDADEWEQVRAAAHAEAEKTVLRRRSSGSGSWARPGTASPSSSRPWTRTTWCAVKSATPCCCSRPAWRCSRSAFGRSARPGNPRSPRRNRQAADRAGVVLSCAALGRRRGS